MKPEGNRVGNCIGWTAKPQRPIGYKEKAKAESCGGLLLESAEAKRVVKGRNPKFGKNL